MTHALILTAMQNISPKRLQRAVCGLADGTLTVTLTRQTAGELRGLVKNGNGAEYGVTLAASLTSCSCKDSLFRGVVCKHAIALALHALRTPAPTPQKPLVHLIWSNGTALCGEQQPERLLPYPWPMTIVERPQQWSEVTLCAACLAERQHPSQLLMKEAA